MHPSRTSIRRLMMIVAVASVLLWMGSTAYYVGYDRGCHWIIHDWERRDSPGITTTPCVAPFWPQYWRRLLGRPWPGTFRCECANEDQMLGIGVGTECRAYRYLSSRAVSPEEAGWVQATLQSLKVIGKAQDLPAVADK